MSAHRIGHGQQLPLFPAGAADPQHGLIPLAAVLVGSAAWPECGCVRGFVRTPRAGGHVGLYCAGHGRWLRWLGAAERARARAAGAGDV